MAHIITRTNGTRAIQWYADGARPSISLASMPMRDCKAILVHVERLLTSRVSGVPVQRDTAKWIGNLPAKFKRKLQKVGLLPDDLIVCDAPRLSVFTAHYIDLRTDVKPNTNREYLATRRELLGYFVADPYINTITQHDCENWVRWMKRKGLSASTYGKRTKIAKMMLAHAVKLKLVLDNPLSSIKAPPQVNRARDYYVTPAVTSQVLAQCPDCEWRLIVALTRYAGLRCPSEVLSLLWSDVLWDQNRFVVRSPKTEHHASGGVRQVPIFPELRPYLQEAYDLAPAGATYVIAKYRAGSGNLNSGLRRIIHRAGLTHWPKLFQNLRASAETDLVGRHPIHAVAAWLGHSTLTASKHYLQLTEEHFRAAAAVSVVDEVGPHGYNQRHGETSGTETARENED